MVPVIIIVLPRPVPKVSVEAAVALSWTMVFLIEGAIWNTWQLVEIPHLHLSFCSQLFRRIVVGSEIFH
jgi:hypothetical protein